VQGAEECGRAERLFADRPALQPGFRSRPPSAPLRSLKLGINRSCCENVPFDTCSKKRYRDRTAAKSAA
jgi:hypothetical protein